MVRKLVIGLAVVVLAAWLVVECVEGRGVWSTPELRHMREMKDRREAPSTVEDMTVDDFARLPANRPISEYAPLERHGVRVEGYVQRIERSPDGDFHLTLEASLPAGKGDRYMTIEITPGWHRGSRWTYEALADRLGAERAGAPAPREQPRRVRITGWLMYDVWYDALPAWVFDRGHRISGWEVHPVTRIEVWDERQKALVPVSR